MPPPSQPGSTDSTNQDLQFALRSLLSAYETFIEEDLANLRSGSANDLDAARNCEYELQAASRLFESFFTQDVATRLLPADARAALGEVSNWSWCLLHARCCLVFGWLVCRSPRTFQAWSYYLYLYWKCVRQVLGTPVTSPPSAAEQDDFKTVLASLAAAYKPFLTDQLAVLEFPAVIPEEIISGSIDCSSGEGEICAVFDRLLQTGTVRALLGPTAFDRYSQSPDCLLCRCWCLCALCLGCCIARARTVQQLLVCLEYYVRCLENCFRPLVCELTAPGNCVQEAEFAQSGIFRGVAIYGTAAGSSCAYYTLEWRQSGIGPWQTSSIVYPAPPPRVHAAS